MSIIRTSASIAGGSADAAPPPQPILSGSGTTDANGNFTIEIPGDLKLADGTPITNSVRLVVEATVTGKDNQVISGRNNILRHSGDFYVGVATRDYMAEAKKPATIDLIAVDWEGNRLPGQDRSTWTIIRREYENKFDEAKRLLAIDAEGHSGLQHDGHDQRQGRSEHHLHAAAGRFVQDHREGHG